jgi:hypothetical protein
MIKDVFHSIASAALRLFANWAALLISLAMYLALLGAVYLFFNVREATAAQLALNLILPIAAVALFFLIQAMGVSYVRIGVGAGYLAKRSLTDGWRILLASLPLILIAVVFIYLFDKADQSFFIMSGAAGSKAMNWSWAAVAVHAVQIFLIHILLPLIAINLWIEAVSQGVAAAFLEIGRVVARAIAPRSLLIYVVICAVFGATVYFLLSRLATYTDPWTQLWAVGIKTALALLLTFVGWMLTLGSIAELTARRAMKELDS